MREIEECIRIWREVFGDSEAEITLFIDNHYHTDNHLFTEMDSHHAAMGHLLSFDSRIGKVGYLYALGTDERYRGRGYGRELTKRAIELSRARGYVALLLIPAEAWLNSYYEDLGFIPYGQLSFCTKDNYDFGTGTPENDLSMVYPIDDSIEYSPLAILELTKEEAD